MQNKYKMWFVLPKGHDKRRLQTPRDQHAAAVTGRADSPKKEHNNVTKFPTKMTLFISVINFMRIRSSTDKNGYLGEVTKKTFVRKKILIAGVGKKKLSRKYA